MNLMSSHVQQDFPKAAFVLSLSVAAFAFLSSIVGLAVPAFYAADPLVLQPQLLGQDLVTLVVAAPLLLLAAWRASKGSLVGYVSVTALMFYMAYAYATYAFGTRFNALFPAYVAILGASTFALFVLIRHLPVHRVTERVWAGMPRRSVAGAALVIVAVFVFLWGADIVPALVEGRPPDSAVQFETPTSSVHVMDLAFLLPLGVIAGVMLLRRQSMGVLLAGVFLIKGITIALAVLSMAAFSTAAGQPINVPVATGISGTLVALLLVGWPYLRALSAEGGSGGNRPRGGSRETREEAAQ